MTEQRSGTDPVTLQLTCPACGGQGAFATWNCIDGTRTPELRQRLLHDENLFFYTCPQCGAKIHVETTCLYIDRERHFMVWHVPDPKTAVSLGDVYRYLGEADFSAYRCRSALTWGEWREKILELESGFDDRMYEIIKYSAYQLLKPDQQKQLPLEMYHIDYAKDDGNAADLALVFMEEEKKGQGYVYAVTAKLLTMTQELYLPLLQKVTPHAGEGKFERFSYAWAGSFMKYVLAAIQQPNQAEYRRLVTYWLATLGQEVFHADLTKK